VAALKESAFRRNCVSAESFRVFSFQFLLDRELAFLIAAAFAALEPF